MNCNKLIKGWENNFTKIEFKDEKAKVKGKLVGRYISEPFADGRAIYVITKELKTKVEIEVCTGIGDDWVIPYWGEKTKIDKKYAIRNINGRDRLEQLFKKV